MRSIRRDGDSDDDHKQRRLDEELIGAEADDHHTHKPEAAYHILNEIVLDRGPSGSMVALDVYGDEECFTTIAADGLIVATPTGSTAYNMAAGGSLCHPDNPVILLTAIAAHTLNFRPIILPDTMVLRIGVPYDARTSAWTNFDGKYRCVTYSRSSSKSNNSLTRSNQDRAEAWRLCHHLRLQIPIPRRIALEQTQRRLD